jgi:hypothetical protein
VIIIFEHNERSTGGEGGLPIFTRKSEANIVQAVACIPGVCIFLMRIAANIPARGDECASKLALFQAKMRRLLNFQAIERVKALQDAVGCL